MSANTVTSYDKLSEPRVDVPEIKRYFSVISMVR
jgi:hypothetical protein